LIGCFVTASGKGAGIGFSTVLAVETLIFIITMWTGIVRKGMFRSATHLAYILYRDSLIFYVFVFVMALANVVVIFNAPGPLMATLMVAQHAVHCVSGTRIVLNVRGGASDNASLTKEMEELETFNANLNFARSRVDKSQHSVLDIPVGAEESTLGRNSEDEKFGS